MNILYHHRTRGRDVEGVHIRGIVHALRALGHSVTVLSFPGADPEQNPTEVHSRTGRGHLAGMVTRLPGVLFEFFELAYNLVTLFRMPLSIRRLRPHMIYERYSLFLWATVWTARRKGIPIILEINDSALVERVRPLSMKSLARRIEAWCMRNSSGLVFISSWFRDHALEAYGPLAPSVISPNAADLSAFDPGRFDRDQLRARLGLSGRVVCGHVGAFAHWHGMDQFVEAISDRLEEAPQLTLVLVGDGSTLSEIRDLIALRQLSDRIVLPGRVAHDEIPAWIACMDYAVLPDSNTYGSPMKLFESMAMGVAMIAPDYAPITEVIEDDVTGWLFPRGDIKACVRKVIELAGQPSVRDKVCRAARNHIVQYHQWRNNAEQILMLVSGEGGHA